MLYAVREGTVVQNLKGRELMIRYSSSRTNNYSLPSTSDVTCSDRLEAQYREIQELRERVRKAEASGLHGGARSRGSAERPILATP
jgi:hypothetical protein